MLWRYAIRFAFPQPPTTIEELKENIWRGTQTVDENILNNVYKKKENGLRIELREAGRHFEHHFNSKGLLLTLFKRTSEPLKLLNTFKVIAFNIWRVQKHPVYVAHYCPCVMFTSPWNRTLWNHETSLAVHLYISFLISYCTLNFTAMHTVSHSLVLIFPLYMVFSAREARKLRLVYYIPFMQTNMIPTFASYLHVLTL